MPRVPSLWAGSDGSYFARISLTYWRARVDHEVQYSSVEGSASQFEDAVGAVALVGHCPVSGYGGESPEGHLQVFAHTWSGQEKDPPDLKQGPPEPFVPGAVTPASVPVSMSATEVVVSGAIELVVLSVLGISASVVVLSGIDWDMRGWAVVCRTVVVLSVEVSMVASSV